MILEWFVRTRQRSRAVKVARRAFEERFPTESPGRAYCVTEECSRRIVCVTYGTTRPPSRSFWAVTDTFDGAQLVEDDGPYRPPVDR